MKNNDSNDPVLERAKSDAFRWATKPEDEREKRTFSRVHFEVPFALSVFVSSLDHIDQLFESARKRISDPNHKIHTLNPNTESKFAHLFADRLLELCVAVEGKRAKLMLETIKDMARPSNSFLGGMFGNPQGELTEEADDDSNV